MSDSSVDREQNFHEHIGYPRCFSEEQHNESKNNVPPSAPPFMTTDLQTRNGGDINDFIMEHRGKIILSAGLFYLLNNTDLSGFNILGNFKSTGFSLEKVKIIVRGPIMTNLLSYWILKIAREKKILKKETCRILSQLAFGASLINLIHNTEILNIYSKEYEVDYFDLTSTKSIFYVNANKYHAKQKYYLNLSKYKYYLSGALGFYILPSKDIEPAVNDLSVDDNNGSNKRWKKIGVVAILVGITYYYWYKW